MGKIFKTSDRSSSISLLSKFASAIREFFATKNEMDVVAASLNDLDVRIKDAIPTISVGTVTTGEEGTKASVTNSGTDKKAVFDFVIPRGATGDMRHSIDNYTDSSGKKMAFFCTLNNMWGLKANPAVSYDYADNIQLPIPSESAIQSLSDCISMDYQVTLYVGKLYFNNPYTWANLHWQLQCSNKNGVVYSTRYSTSDTYFYFAYDKVNNVAISGLSTIDIVVSYEKGKYYVQATIENSYGRAYYQGLGFETKQI